jgi:O-antigen/teichoic acid export membrane protein
MVAGSLLGVALSYMMHSYRPWFSLRRRREIWSYSAWIMVIHVASYVTSVVDNLVVGNRGGTTAMGYYSVAYGVATLPVLELVQPTWRGVFPVYASVADDAARFKQSFLDVLRVVCLLAIPLSVGCSMVAPDFVYVALGEQWLDIVPVVAWLALSAMAMIFSEAMFTVITVGHRPRNTALMMVARFIAMVPAAYIGYAYDGLDGAAIARTALMFAFLPLIYVGLRTVMVIRIDELLACLARPILGASTMVGALMLIHPLIPDIPLLRLVIEGAAGALTFAAAVLGFWILSGRPQGPERFVWDYMGAFLSGHAARGALRGTVGGGKSDA